jgi:predicted nucleic acid-binding protein
MYLLDTNVVSELRKVHVGKADSRVAGWAWSVPVVSQFLSAVTILELEAGILRMERKDPAQGASLRSWMDGIVLRDFSGRILPIDFAVALRCAQLHVPDPYPEIDAMIAATALVHGMTVVTRNVADFARTGVAVFNPWEA